MENQHHQSGLNEKIATLNVMVFVADVWATSLQVFLHIGFGQRYLGRQAAAVLLLIPIYTLFWPNDDLRLIVLFLPAYLLMCGLARLSMLSRHLKGGRPIHSRYNGLPMFGRLLPFIPEVTFKMFIEPALVFAAGYFLLTDNKPLGYYVMIGAVCMAAQLQLSEAWMRMRATDMHDAMIEQEILAERFRNMRGDEF